MKKKCALILCCLIFSFPAIALPQPLHVVTSFSILADMVKTIGGNDVDVTSLVGPDTDAHTYQPTPEDAKKLAHADLIFVNGLGFEGWMDRLVQASGTKAKIITVTDSMKPRIMVSLQGVPDPHAWQNLANGRLYIRAIANALETAIPAHALLIEQQTKSYDALMASVDQSLRSKIDKIPVSQRKVITNHDAFAYFGAAYGIQFLAPVGLNTEAEPSAADVAKLIQQIKTEGIKVVFLENMTNAKLMQQIANDTNAQIGGTLYADALSGPRGQAPNYLSMFRHNINLICAAMLKNKP